MVREEFPSDSRFLWTARKDTCVQVQFASRILGAVLATPSIGDKDGLVMVELENIASSGNSVAAPQAFNSASFDLGGTATSAGAPAC